MQLGERRRQCLTSSSACQIDAIGLRKMLFSHISHMRKLTCPKPWCSCTLPQQNIVGLNCLFDLWIQLLEQGMFGCPPPWKAQIWCPLPSTTSHFVVLSLVLQQIWCLTLKYLSVGFLLFSLSYIVKNVKSHLYLFILYELKRTLTKALNKLGLFCN